MQPSSLVFVAIIAGWAVLLLPHWVSRREALNASRGADRDSARLRVLARRPGAAPSVNVTARRSSTPLLPAQGVPTVAARRGPGLVGRPADRSASRAAATRRARVLITLTIVSATCWGIVALPGVAWWTALPATALLVTDLALLGAAGRRRAADRRAAARRTASRIAGAQRAAGERLGAAGSVAPAAGTRAEPQIDLDAVDRDERAAQRPAAATADGTWTPVPVPVPTYMLKPVVERPQPRPLDDDVPPAPLAAVAAVDPVPAPARPWEVEHTWADDLDLFLARRRAVNG